MSKTTEVVPQLNSLERSNLRLCEETIQKHMSTFVEVGTALTKIRDDRLYRETHKSFDAYVREKWDIERTYAHRLIAAAGVVETVANCQHKPTSEAQVRPLVELPAEQQAEAWTAAVEKAKEEGKPVTAAIVEAVVEEMLEPAEKCPNCGGTERDEDGDCAKCKEPAKHEPTLEERMEASNKALDGLARDITALHKQATELAEPHLEKSGRLEILKGQLRAAAGTVRAAKGNGPCPYCQGKGCKHCYGTGWANKATIEVAPA